MNTRYLWDDLEARLCELRPPMDAVIGGDMSWKACCRGEYGAVKPAMLPA